MIAFSVTAVPETLFVFPNLFENLYLYVLIARRIAPRFIPRTAGQMAILLVILFIPKAAQEWLLHWEEAHPWQWLRDTFIRPILGG